mmetsp:Transcript_7976/g.15027  ORF Transcript_7976/g.15027 Transcript_7976/m.15027 type:complete len:565 (-) Transcript_7976:46-1740(-)|eukprot:CAMPEP_0176485586 /NCGR_PEP_ID=MMETSP0200_2-20121128/5116_1 /TAXON_ID=947934 /ORGANISM="Chaetoceros sp., Strain GSL56" /LENGTH=564 /DNA_ID=CAMNT_0017882235 /DNA_START=232 /DNA_END=1923 /DNA_ORIENTATION=+
MKLSSASSILVTILSALETDAYISTRSVINTYNSIASPSSPSLLVPRIELTFGTKRTLLYVTHDENTNGDHQQQPLPDKKRGNIRSKVSEIAKRIVTKPITAVAPQAIAEILTDATTGAVDLALEEVNRLGKLRQRISYSDILEKEAAMESDTVIALDTIALAKTTAADAFALAEAAIEETEDALKKSKLALAKCREDVAKAIAIAEKSAYQANIASQKATVLAASAAITASGNFREEEEGVEKRYDDEEENSNTSVRLMEEKEEQEQEQDNLNDINAKQETSTSKYLDISSLDYKDVEYHLSEMQPPFIGENQCLVPGEAVVRVEKATDNSRRIFAGIDIMASVDDVWNVLTDYENLQKVVPNLVVNEVLELYQNEDLSSTMAYEINPNISSEEQCKALSKKMKGAKLRQVGGAKVVGINFSAQVTLEVREWPNGMPDFFHFSDEIYEGKSRAERAKLERQRKLERYHFPRPFAISKLPTKDISMQSVEDDDGEFRLYQGVWRMQPLPGCAPPGESAMRLTYAVEISPRPYLPVALVEGRISKDLCNNLLAVRDFVTTKRISQ